MSDTERWLVAELSEQLRQALDALTGLSSVVEPGPPAPEEPGAAPLWWEQPLSAGPNAIVWVGAAEHAWREIGLCTLRAAGIDECDPAEMRSTWMEIMSQALSALARAIGARLNKDVTCSAGREATESGPACARLSVNLGTPEVLSIDLAFSPGLLALFAPPGAAARDESMAVQPARPPSGTQTSPIVEGSKTLDLLLEVELPVSVSFGRAQLRLKDVIKLTSGSIVELNRAVTEPVEVIVNNCVIARGEVVVIDGYYGVRVNQIISRQDRLRTLA